MILSMNTVDAHTRTHTHTIPSITANNCSVGNISYLRYFFHFKFTNKYLVNTFITTLLVSTVFDLINTVTIV